MNTMTWVMMVFVLGTCWGGFAVALIVGMRLQGRAERERDDA